MKLAHISTGVVHVMRQVLSKHVKEQIFTLAYVQSGPQKY
jgi:hypothetical protein